MKPDDLRIVASLLRAERIAALATLRDGWPFASMVAFAPEADFSGFLMHLSSLSPHTRHLAADSRASLLITERDDGREDPQTLARITLIGQVAQLAPDAAEYRAACDLYGARLPASAMLFDFADRLRRVVAHRDNAFRRRVCAGLHTQYRTTQGLCSFSRAIMCADSLCAIETARGAGLRAVILCSRAIKTTRFDLFLVLLKKLRLTSSSRKNAPFFNSR